MNTRRRQSTRLPRFDYTRQGAYFVTLCTRNRACLFGDIVNGEMRLNDIGNLADGLWQEIPVHFPQVEIDAWIVMPNHVLREIHGVLLSHGRGSDQDPGEFRRSQNWIGGTRPGNAIFVPPPQTAVPDCMTAFERFLHAEADGLPVLLRAGLSHVQFETIHPFLDGNGRVGRLLITLLLCQGRTAQPLLYLSLYSSSTGPPTTIC